MTLAELLAALPATEADDPAFPTHLLGAFRRKSITYCTGVTDQETIVYWFQSRSFTIDLRLSDGARTPVAERQGWIGDTLWNAATRQLSWAVGASYQLHDQWPEPAGLIAIGNSVIEVAPSGAYVEDWRQQSVRGPLLGMRLTGTWDEASGTTQPMDGGLIVAGEHIAFVQSRTPRVRDALRGATSLTQALADGVASNAEAESHEVSVAIGGAAITHGTQPCRIGEPIAAGDFDLRDDGTVTLARTVDGSRVRLVFSLDVHRPDHVFDRTTDCTPAARDWMRREHAHLARHATVVG